MRFARFSNFRITGFTFEVVGKLKIYGMGNKQEREMLLYGNFWTSFSLKVTDLFFALPAME